MTLEKLLGEELPAIGGNYWSAHQLKKNGEVWYLIFTQSDEQGKPEANAKWVVTNRHSQDRPDVYCVIGEGDRVLPLQSLHNTNFDERYGMPGSGHPRCGNPIDALEGVKIRAWASREHGKSVIISLTGAQTVSYVLLLSYQGGYWITLQKKQEGSTCYLDRGNDSDFRLITLDP